MKRFTATFNFGLGLALGLLLQSAPARAGEAEKAAAITAFDEGLVLLDAGKTSAACDKLQQSYQLDQQLGSLMHLANCREINGQLASAWSSFRDAAEWAHKQGDERETLAGERAAALVARVPKLQLELPPTLPPGLTISRNGQKFPESLWRSATPVDLGVYEFLVSAEGYVSFKGSVEVAAEGATATFTIPALAPLTAEPPAPLSDSAQTAEADERPLLARKWPALVAAGVGVAGGVVWAIFGVQSLGSKSSADACTPSSCTAADSNGYLTAARDAGTVATVAMVVTGVGLAAAGVLWFALPDGAPKDAQTAHLAPSILPRPTALRVGLLPGGVTLSGKW